MEFENVESMRVETPIMTPYSDEWMAWMFTAGTIGHRIAVELRDKLAAAQQRIAELEASRGVEPDWHISPTWAQYWAVDADGAAYWYEVEPNAKGAMGYWGKGAGRCELDPIRRSFSWLDTLRRRQAQEGEEG